jgi:hypothetical protein
MNDTSFKPRRARPESRLVPYEEFGALFSQLRQALGNNKTAESMEYVGYAGASHVSEWKRKGKVPVLAMNAIRGVLAELRIAPQARVIRPFSIDELALMFTCIMKSDEPRRGALLAKLAKELADATRD